MAIGLSVSIKTYGGKGIWVIMTQWGKEVRDFYTTDHELAKQVARDWQTEINQSV